jgi:Zn finger protein HypA/HybF involved in hydrogenase expression
MNNFDISNNANLKNREKNYTFKCNVCKSSDKYMKLIYNKKFEFDYCENCKKVYFNINEFIEYTYYIIKKTNKKNYFSIVLNYLNSFKERIYVKK